MQDQKILNSLNEENKVLLDRILTDLKIGDRSTIDSLSDHEAKYVLSILKQMSETGESSINDALWEIDYTEKPVSIEHFITDMNYLGKIGRMLYDTWKQELSIVCAEDSKVLEWIITGGTGLGKTTAAQVAQIYKLYRLLCLKDPQTHYNLMDTTSIAIALFNITIDKAYTITYKPLEAMIKTSPWFMERVKFNRTESWVELPKKVEFAVGSQAAHAIGAAVIGGIMDENDFGRMDNQTEDTYNAVMQRMDSRFEDFIYTSPPGLLSLISSTTQSPDSFTNRRLDALEKSTTRRGFTHVSVFPRWVVKPAKVYEGKKFPVFLGDDLRSPVLLLDDYRKEDFDNERIIWVPEHFRPQFETDIYTSIGDIAGQRIGVGSKFLYLNRKDLLYKCIDNERQAGHPFLNETVVITIDSEKKIVESFKPEMLFTHYNDRTYKWGPIVNRNEHRYIHIDLSKTGDCTGIACVHGNGYTESTEISEGKHVTVRLPKVYVDFVLQISSAPGSEIDFSKIRDFVMYLLSMGMKVGGISYDSWNSTDSLQYFTKSRLIPHVDTISVDRSPEPYNQLRELIVSNRISLYKNEILFDEILNLIRNPDSKKVDHPQEGSKDVSDGLAGAVKNLLTYYEPLVRSAPSDDMFNKKKTMSVDDTFHIEKIKPKLNL